MLYSLINIYYFQTSFIDLNYNLLFSKYILFSKFIVLFIGFLILLVVKDKIIKADFATNNFLLLFNILLFYLLIFLSSFDLIVLFISLEGVSLILYGLGSILIINLISLEGIIKYFLLSSITGCLTIFGLSLIFCLFGSVDFLELQLQLTSNIQNLTMVSINIIILITFLSLFFKMAFFPFH